MLAVWSSCHFDLINCIGAITFKALGIRIVEIPIYLCGSAKVRLNHKLWIHKTTKEMFNIVPTSIHLHTALCLAWHRLKNQFTLKWAPHFPNAQKAIWRMDTKAKSRGIKFVVLDACNCAGTGNFSRAKKTPVRFLIFVIPVVTFRCKRIRIWVWSRLKAPHSHGLSSSFATFNNIWTAVRSQLHVFLKNSIFCEWNAQEALDWYQCIVRIEWCCTLCARHSLKLNEASRLLDIAFHLSHVPIDWRE